ncbi:tyrosine-protein phosphatase [Lactobacillus sp. ESL0236]|uniref:tyrosine-protein phosphatase n=1 Tax=unclassified Lactobacillus TaxID=2620435 RepID=UPI000EFD46DD|nr:MULTISPECIES: tyrosine-protein phosphatase [unclassified Lactobacillus]RMC38661.1 tyrosine-protein phosphatase [Lactobacillus sp. ESL0237]RMC43006.1 tyrosine-protein phosphatase [Lactobacillus sp. ESL0234]RMC43860.1 tyrosine-protein phosphatase [Lactobacillus sp. ESL0236]
MTKNLTNQLIPIKNGRNFRELGGYKTIDGKTIKKHKLLRTANWATLDKADLQFLQDYGAKYIVDFRSKDEVNQEPDRVPEGVTYKFDPVFSEDLTNSSKGIDEIISQENDDPKAGFNHMFIAYDDMIKSESAQKAYRKFFDILLANTESDKSVLFHCTAGKDRTGLAAILILSALNVPLATIRADYLFTNTATKDFVNNFLQKAKDKGANDVAISNLKDLQTVCPEYFDYVINTINKNYGSLENYLHDIMRLTDDKIAQLRKIYLD